MIHGEAPVVGRVPILRRDHQIKTTLDPIHDGNHFIAVRNTQRASWQKIVLNIDHDQAPHKAFQLLTF
jgi:hypothetical protein